MTLLKFPPPLALPIDVAKEIENRIASAKGKKSPHQMVSVEDRVAAFAETAPDPSEAPMLRSDEHVKDVARVYVHDQCGEATVVSGSSLTWVCNPMRMTMGTMTTRGTAHTKAVARFLF